MLAVAPERPHPPDPLSLRGEGEIERGVGDRAEQQPRPCSLHLIFRQRGVAANHRLAEHQLRNKAVLRRNRLMPKTNRGDIKLDD